MRRRASSRSERGQVVVVFALSLVTLMGIAGLALDGGSTFAQRRDQQTATDLAALGAANDYMVNGTNWWWSGIFSGTSRARDIASHNGFTHGQGGTSVYSWVDTGNGVSVTVNIDSPHANTLARVFGMNTWTVSTEATALAGFPDSAEGAAPFIFSAHAFATDGTPLYTTLTAWNETNGDIPTSATDIAWTNYGTGNLDTSQVDQIITGDLVINRTIEFGQYIGQHNNGNHTALYGDVDTYLSGLELPVPVVDDNGNFAGWAMFHVTSASGGSAKHVYGYFLSNFVSAQLNVTNCAANACPRYLGSYVLKLTN